MFLALPWAGRAEVLAGLAHWETVRARDAYAQLDGPIDGKLLRRSNEYVHRLTGHAVALLRRETTPDRDASFMDMVVEVLAERGREELDRLATRLHEAQSRHGGLPSEPITGP